MTPISLRSIATAATVAALLTACSGSPGPALPASGGGGTADSVAPAAPAPQKGPAEAPELTRDVVTTASMTVTVADPSAAADRAAVIVEDAGGRVDSRSEDAGTGAGRAQTSVVLRVPSATLDAVVRDLKALGEVQTAETTAEDVTAQRVDLDARIRALQTSVDRLLAIMRDARDPDALITAEGALSQRQAELDSLRAQRDQLGDRVDFATVTVTLVAEQPGGPGPTQYRGFSGQVERGWDALVTVATQGVLLVGLFLPWLGALLVVALVGYLVTRLAGSRRRIPAETATIPGGDRGSSDGSAGDGD